MTEVLFFFIECMHTFLFAPHPSDPPYDDVREVTMTMTFMLLLDFPTATSP